jgi:hypothetical protein
MGRENGKTAEAREYVIVDRERDSQSLWPRYLFGRMGHFGMILYVITE